MSVVKSRPFATKVELTYVVLCRKSPDGEGCETFDHWEMRVHKRLLEMKISTGKDETALRKVASIPIPDTVSIELSLRHAN
jgi:small subunit ribosomal protein S10